MNEEKNIEYRLDTATKYMKDSQKRIEELDARIQKAINSIFDRPPSDDIEMYKIIIKTAKDALIQEKHYLEMAQKSKEAAEQQQSQQRESTTTATAATATAITVTVTTEEHKMESPPKSTPNEIITPLASGSSC